MDAFAMAVVASKTKADSSRYLTHRHSNKYLINIYNDNYKRKLDARLAERPCIRLQTNLWKKVISKPKAETGRREFDSPTSLFDVISTD
ncbi:MAG: hypothetical protein J7K31_04095 [Candidatus Aenigmarchaeota archaeon]|nr:hypothetical protein [Candidatus Aenigmarchaeota archaeon]